MTESVHLRHTPALMTSLLLMPVKVPSGFLAVMPATTLPPWLRIRAETLRFPPPAKKARG
jgi:hypothetical protein